MLSAIFDFIPLLFLSNILKCMFFSSPVLMGELQGHCYMLKWPSINGERFTTLFYKNIQSHRHFSDEEKE